MTELEFIDQMIWSAESYGYIDAADKLCNLTFDRWDELSSSARSKLLRTATEFMDKAIKIREEHIPL